jgi:hypothetical protein
LAFAPASLILANCNLPLNEALAFKGIVVFKNFIVLYFGFTLAGITLFILYSGYEEYTLHLKEKEIEQKQQEVINTIDSLINSCIQEASKFHSEAAEIKYIYRKSTRFVRIDYTLTEAKVVYQAVCSQDSDSKVRFSPVG